jgi:hypothetical protein
LSRHRVHRLDRDVTHEHDNPEVGKRVQFGREQRSLLFDGCRRDRSGELGRFDRNRQIDTAMDESLDAVDVRSAASEGVHEVRDVHRIPRRGEEVVAGLGQGLANRRHPYRGGLQTRRQIGKHHGHRATLLSVAQA